MQIDYLEDDSFRQIKPNQKLETQFTSTFFKFNRHNFEKIKKLQQQKLVHIRKKKNPLQLKQIVTKAKVDILKKNFVRKLKRGKTHSFLPQNMDFQKQEGNNLLKKILMQLESKDGFDLSPVMLCIWSFINIVQISIMIIIFSIQITFPETQDEQYFVGARIFSIFLYVVDMILNFTSQKHEIGVNKRNLKQIGEHYLLNHFILDFINIAIFPLSYAFNSSTVTPFVMLIALFKLKNNLSRFESFQFIYVKNSTRELYYSLIKVFLLNFTIGHILSILLNLMASLNDSSQCWYKIINIIDEPWITKYIWGYYWGTNIMLTVGFGDVAASNLTEATCLVFIQTISCITLAYNISCVGSIISELKAQNEEKKKKLKYFYRMCEENKISQEMEHKVNNYIEESYLIKEQFQLEKYDEVINSLPQSMQSEYRKQANKCLFNVGFFISFNTRTILSLADCVIRRVAHPDEIIQRRKQIQNLCILQKGTLGFACRSNIKCNLNGLVKAKIDITKGQNPKIISLGFIKRKQLPYDIKSLFYSVYYYLPYEQLVKVLSPFQMDYHFFLYMKDKAENILGSNQIMKCKYCEDDYHTLFECPKFHYIPLIEKVLNKNTKKQAVEKVGRNSIKIKRNYKKFPALLQKQLLLQGQTTYLTQNFDQDEIKQIQNIKKYFQKANLNNSLILNEGEQNMYDFLIRSQKTIYENQYDMIENILTKNTIANKGFWSLQCDAGYDFKYYFKQYNPNRLIQFKLNLEKRKPKDMIFGLYAFRIPQHAATKNYSDLSQTLVQSATLHKRNQKKRPIFNSYH